MMPPLMTVGSRWPASSSAATIDVVVVLPCVPAMATVDFSRINSASISARRTTGMRRSSAASTSGLPRRIAVDVRSEEHTSELQSLMRISYAVFCLKKKKTQHLRIPLTEYYQHDPTAIHNHHN